MPLHGRALGSDRAKHDGILRPTPSVGWLTALRRAPWMSDDSFLDDQLPSYLATLKGTTAGLNSMPFSSMEQGLSQGPGSHRGACGTSPAANCLAYSARPPGEVFSLCIYDGRRDNIGSTSVDSPHEVWDAHLVTALACCAGTSSSNQAGLSSGWRGAASLPWMDRSPLET